MSGPSHNLHQLGANTRWPARLDVPEARCCRRDWRADDATRLVRDLLNTTVKETWPPWIHRSPWGFPEGPNDLSIGGVGKGDLKLDLRRSETGFDLISVFQAQLAFGVARFASCQRAGKQAVDSGGTAPLYFLDSANALESADNTFELLAHVLALRGVRFSRGAIQMRDEGLRVVALVRSQRQFRRGLVPIDYRAVDTEVLVR